MKKFALPISFLLLLSSCGTNEPPEDLVSSVDKNGSIESSVQVAHLDSARDILTTKHVVWKDNAEATTIIHTDTVPTLGFGTVNAYDKVTGKETTTQGRRDYNIFITVK